ncbi:MAG: hypothetical protein EVA89_00715 [Sandaracinaceae bacterium]|nr:MAG: hypothetical protein EVA89_00715 [Sandaracinaceae bacterium]
MGLLRFTRCPAPGYFLLACLGLGCGAPFGSPDGGSEDAGGGASIDCSPETDWLFYEYQWGDARGETGCIAAVYLEDHWESPSRVGPARRIALTYRGDAAIDSTLRGLPSGFCGATLVFENVDLRSGTSGELVDITDVAGDGYDENVYAILSYEESTTPGEECDGEHFRARLRAGRWIIHSAGSIGEVVRAEARDVIFEDVRGRPVHFSRMHWQVRVTEAHVVR